jgi:hypothetical protein
MTRISSWPIGPRAAVKAIFVPSGDHAGALSSRASFVRSIWPDPSAFMTKTSLWSSSNGNRVNAIRVPSGDQAGS